jgi:hypothetical protein
MSHSIYLYDPALTKQRELQTIAEFGDVLAELQDKSPGPNPKFRQFARLLVALGKSASWLGDAVETAEAHTGALWNFDLPPDDPVRAMRHVVDCARAAGLGAYDDEIGMGFLSDGRVVPAERQQEWEDLLDALEDEPQAITKGQMRTKLRQALEGLLAPHGFAIDQALAKKDQADVSLSRPIGGGHQKLNVWIEGASPEFRCSIHLTGYLDAVTELFERLLPKPFPGRGRTFGFELRDLADDFETRRLWLEPKANFRKTIALLEEKALPLMNRAQDTEGVDWLMNSQDSPLRALMKRWCTWGALATAFVARNPAFAKLAEELVESSRNRVDGTPAELRALLAYTRGAAH